MITLCASKIHFKILFEFFRSIILSLKAIFSQKTFQITWKCFDSYNRSTFVIVFYFCLNDCKVEELLSPPCKTTSTLELPNFIIWSKPRQTPPQTFWTESVLVLLTLGSMPCTAGEKADAMSHSSLPYYMSGLSGPFPAHTSLTRTGVSSPPESPYRSAICQEQKKSRNSSAPGVGSPQSQILLRSFKTPKQKTRASL